MNVSPRELPATRNALFGREVPDKIGIMYKILVSAPYLQMEFEKYRERFAQERLEPILPRVHERLEEDELLPLIGDADGIICGDDRITAKVLDHAKRLKVIVKWGTGIDSIDKEYAEKKGISVHNSPNAFTAPVSESVLAYILAYSRNILRADRLMKAGHWQKVQGFSLSEKCVGIIGVGNIGRAVAQRLKVFGPRVLGNDIVDIPEEVCRGNNIEMVPLNVLLAESDFISVHCTLNRTSRHLLRKEQFLKMKPEAILINTARGPIIKEADLVWALQTRTIAGAALDVFEQEPLPPSSSLRWMSNVMLSPHGSNSSPLCWQRVHENSIAMLCAALNGSGINRQQRLEN
jgi:D-3-phosphoglycerate dehydrogenase